MNQACNNYPYGQPNNLPNPDIAPSPYWQPGFIPQQPSQWPQPGSFGFGMDPNPAFTAAINRLAAALEKLSEA